MQRAFVAIKKLIQRPFVVTLLLNRLEKKRRVIVNEKKCIFYRSLKLLQLLSLLMCYQQRIEHINVYMQRSMNSRLAYWNSLPVDRKNLAIITSI